MQQKSISKLTYIPSSLGRDMLKYEDRANFVVSIIYSASLPPSEIRS